MAAALTDVQSSQELCLVDRTCLAGSAREDAPFSCRPSPIYNTSALLAREPWTTMAEAAAVVTATDSVAQSLRRITSTADFIGVQLQ